MSRVALTVSLILSALIFVSQFNAYFSWYRVFALEPIKETALGVPRDDPVPHLREKVIDQWISGRSFKIPFADIPILPSDIAILGGLALWISTVFFLFYSRREHFAVCHLLRDASRTQSQETREAVLHSVLSGFVFLAITSRTAPYTSLSEVPDLPETERPYMRWFSMLLISSPPLVLFFSIAMDLYSYFLIDSPFRGYPPWKEWQTNVGSLITRNLISLIFAIMTAFYCFAAFRFQTATNKVVKEYVDTVAAEQS